MSSFKKQELLEAIIRNPGQKLHIYEGKTGQSELNFVAKELLAERLIFRRIKGNETRYRYYPSRSTRIRKEPFYISSYVFLSKKDVPYGQRLVDRLEQEKEIFDVSDYGFVEKDSPKAKKGEYFIRVSLIPEMDPELNVLLGRFQLEMIEQE